VIEMRHPHPLASPAISMAVLAASAIFEGASLAVSYRQSRRIVARHPGRNFPVSSWRYIKLSKDPNMYESLLEDSAALIGIAIAAVGVLGSAVLGLWWMDGAASIAIGLLLICVSYVIAYATRSLVAGEGVAPPLRIELEKALKDGGFDTYCSNFRSLHLGPETILITLTVSAEGRSRNKRMADYLDEVTHCLKAVDARIRHVFFTLK
jgi:divalent metal cation (Fe/Co/Zn/Cd) transporter